MKISCSFLKIRTNARTVGGFMERREAGAFCPIESLGGGVLIEDSRSIGV